MFQYCSYEKKILLSSFLLIASCATPLSSNGKKVRIITADQKKNCEYIDLITESNEVGWDSAGDMQNAMNEAKNQSSILGGNALFLISSTVNSESAIIQVEVYRCKFKKYKELKEI